MNATFLRFPGGLAKALTLSYDDGVIHDIRLIEIMNKNGIKGAFHVNAGLFAKEPTNHRMTVEQAFEAYANGGHEISLHSYSHPFLDALPEATASLEVLRDKQEIEQLTGTVVRGMSYPMGKYNQNVLDILKNAGIAYCRTTISTKKFDIPQNWLALDPTCHHKDPELMTLAKTFVEKDVKYKPMLFYLWGHSYEFDRAKNWNVIEEFCEYVGGRDDVWYPTSIELRDYCDAFDHLIWSVDLSTVHNPSNTTVWVERSIQGVTSGIIKIEPGETLHFEG